MKKKKRQGRGVYIYIYIYPATLITIYTAWLVLYPKRNGTCVSNTFRLNSFCWYLLEILHNDNFLSEDANSIQFCVWLLVLPFRLHFFCLFLTRICSPLTSNILYTFPHNKITSGSGEKKALEWKHDKHTENENLLSILLSCVYLSMICLHIFKCVPSCLLRFYFFFFFSFILYRCAKAERKRVWFPMDLFFCMPRKLF